MGIITNSGTIDVAFSGMHASNPDRDRGALDATQPLGDLARDFIFGPITEAASLDVTVTGLDAGSYRFYGYIHDNSLYQGLMDVEYSVNGGNSFMLGADDVVSTFGTNPAQIGTGRFDFEANGSDSVVFSVAYDGDGAN